MPFRSILILFALLMATLACSFSSREPAQPTATQIASVASPTFIVPPTSTSAVINTPAPSATPVRTSGGNTPCFVRTDWQIYIVQAGDTVSNIAARVGSNATALALANCLTNANSIVVGQALRVPVLPPPTATRTPVPNNPPTTAPNQPIGSMFVSDFISGDAGYFSLLRGETITLTWDRHPNNLANATFYIAPYGVPDPYAPQYVVGYDDNPANGVFVSYMVHAGLNGQLFARGLIAGSGGLASYISNPTPVSSAPSPELGCFMSASTDQGVPIYRYNDPNSQLVGTLTRDVQVQIMGRAVNGWYAFDPGNASSSGSSFLHWIPVGSALSFSGMC
jgi:LysM repeat protein